MRERHTRQKSISFTESMYAKIDNTAKKFNVSFADVVRECINRELDRLIDRENKRKRSQEKS